MQLAKISRNHHDKSKRNIPIGLTYVYLIMSFGLDPKNKNELGLTKASQFEMMATENEKKSFAIKLGERSPAETRFFNQQQRSQQPTHEKPLARKQDKQLLSAREKRL